MDVCRRYPFSELTISCFNTDVLLILLNCFEQLPSTTVFKTTEHCYNLRSTLERFTPLVCKALLGFDAMMGSDQTERFYGYTKQSCWNIFFKSTNDTLDAFIHLRASDLIQDTDFLSLESFVAALYCKNKVPLDVKKLA